MAELVKENKIHSSKGFDHPFAGRINVYIVGGWLLLSIVAEMLADVTPKCNDVKKDVINGVLGGRGPCFVLELGKNCVVQRQTL